MTTPTARRRRDVAHLAGPAERGKPAARPSISVGCQFCDEGARRPPSRMRSRSSRAMGWLVYWRTLRHDRIASHVCMAQSCCTAARTCRRPATTALPHRPAPIRRFPAPPSLRPGRQPGLRRSPSSAPDGAAGLTVSRPCRRLRARLRAEGRWQIVKPGGCRTESRRGIPTPRLRPWSAAGAPRLDLPLVRARRGSGSHPQADQQIDTRLSVHEARTGPW